MILAHRHILDTAQKEGRDGLQPTAASPGHLDHTVSEKHSTHSGRDLPVFISHTVSVVQIGKRLGCPPGLQVAGHPDRCSHLSSVQCGSGTIMVLWAATLHLEGHQEPPL